MSRTDMPEEIAAEIRRRVFEEPGLMKVTQSVRKNGATFRISIRPVSIRGEKRYQGEMTDNGRTTVKNFDLPAAQSGLEEMITQKGPRELHLITKSGDLHVRITHKGKALVSRSGQMDRTIIEAPAHDHVKQTPLTSFDSAALLRVIGLTDGDDRIKASMRGKYDQVNELLRMLDATIDYAALKDQSLSIVDCGRAYLTLAAYEYLTSVHHLKVRVAGIDRNAEIMATARKLAEALACSEDVTFIDSDIDKADPGFKPDLVMSLHACDTATDEALARGVEWGCRYFLSVPCCQHELHKLLGNGGGPMQSVLRYGILRERLADLLTDTFRAQILRILGYRVSVIEFVSFEATARNILLKAESGVQPGQQTAVSDYVELRDFWHVSPWLEKRLATLLEPYLKTTTLKGVQA